MKMLARNPTTPNKRLYTAQPICPNESDVTPLETLFMLPIAMRIARTHRPSGLFLGDTPPTGPVEYAAQTRIDIPTNMAFSINWKLIFFISFTVNLTHTEDSYTTIMEHVNNMEDRLCLKEDMKYNNATKIEDVFM
jgi:hypothetical protein